MRRCVPSLLWSGLLLVWTAGAAAKIPPMSPERLQKHAHLIVEGQVLKVTRDGPITRDHCYGWQPHVALVKAGKVHKGKLEGKTFRLKYRTRVENNKRCVGGGDSYSFRPRSRYKFHLKRSRDKKGKVYYVLFNWAGLKRLK